MYPYDIVFGMDLYTILISVGVIVCMAFIRLQADWRKMKAKLQNLILFNTIAAVVLGYGFAVLFQAFYNYMASGHFEIVNSTGSTFYGGLIGGTAMFIVIYFVAGRFLYADGYHVRQFRDVSDLAPAAITVAHGFGRLGCLMAGCCYGARSDAWYAVQMVGMDHKVIPVQLFEALFLFALSAVLLILYRKGKRYEMPIYMITYACWRFVAEILRGDYRGATVVDFLTPSQLISVLLLAGGLVLLAVELYLDRRSAAIAPVPASEEEAHE
ncbi:MAG: prolipoprotein diacylglyceryl transferase [Ruminococcaceae bacterium]|nr:prolipoprotein diacylglyceryl transferase [Oscillospiraceae bacterium]